MRHDDPIYLAKYNWYRDLLDNLVLKQLRWYVKKTKKITRILKSSKDKQRRNTVKILSGMNIPCDHK